MSCLAVATENVGRSSRTQIVALDGRSCCTVDNGSWVLLLDVQLLGGHLQCQILEVLVGSLRSLDGRSARLNPVGSLPCHRKSVELGEGA